VSALDTAAIAEIANKTGAAGELAARGDLNKRGKTTCGGVGWQPHMDAANVQLASNGDGRWYNVQAWGWVRTTFLVNYPRVPLARLWLTLAATDLF
jgi:hypothetical protein